MVNIFRLLNWVLRWLVKPAGVRPELVEVEPGTIMNFWVPTRKPNRYKPALVFLHGFAANAIITWPFQVFSLAKTYDVYMPDFIFFGESVTDRPERSPEFQAECVAKGLRKLGVEKCVLVGFSYGVVVGFKMSEMFPEMVAAMVATSAPATLTESVSRGSLKKMGFRRLPEFLIPESVKGVRLMLEMGSYKLPPIPDWVLRHFMEALVLENKEEREELLNAMIVPDENLTPVDRYPQRIHIIWGRNDHIFDVQNAYDLKRRLGKKATVDLIEKAGHLVHLERPFLYNNCLKNFLQSFFHFQRN